FWPTFEEPEGLVRARVIALGAAALLLPLVGLGRPGQAGRALAALLAVDALFFALYSGGDWMRGHRWLAMGIVPMVVLLADAILGLRDALSRRPSRLGAGLLALCAMAPIAL